MRLEIENISLSGNELEFSVKIFRQLWLQNLISIFNFCRSQIEVFLISRLSILLFTFSQIFLASRNRRFPFFRSWKFWVEKIFSFAFHFLWDFSRQKKSKISFLPLHWSSLPKICIESQNRKNQISEIQIQLIFST